ncbi:FAD-binding oxidoreductase [Terricaulis sp.]|uniref:FAD-binding oxidoreductase n=1 Tax=Terricaulis sp. TaxID=2768686 RepID=UPI003784EB5A
MTAPLPPALIDKARALLGERFTTAGAVCDQHAGAGMHLRPLPPQAVAFVHSIDEIAALVQACNASAIAIIPYGAGTSLECHVGAARGGVCLDLSGMQKLISVNEEDLDCTVEAGMTRTALNQHLRHTGLFFPVDPGADATIGGMASTRASGTTTVRYGGMRENVLGLTVVTPTGEVVRTARRARKSAAGYDLTHLFVGAEGTLGVIAEVTLRLFGVPEAIGAAVCAFPSASAATTSVVEAIQQGLPLARAEYLDGAAMAAVNTAFKMNREAGDTLFLEFHGAPEEVSRCADRFKAIALGNGGGEFEWAIDAEARSALWRARHHAGFAIAASRPGAVPWSTDVCVPISRLAECIVQTKADLARAPFPAAVLGHIGDGNFHVVLMLDPKAPQELAAAERFNDALVARAIDMDGTCTGEHGVGLGKREALVAELGAGVALMRSIKGALDPLGLMNPEKIFR